MTWGRRTVAPAVLVAVATALAGCSDGQPPTADAPGVVIPGSTVTIGSDPSDVAPSAPSEPSEPTSTTPGTAPATSPPPSEPPAPVEATSATASELITRVGAGMTPSETARVEVGDGSAVGVEADYRYLPLATPTFEAAVGGAEVRLVDGTLYTRPSADVAWSTGADVEPELADYADWNLLGDLRALLEDARGFTGTDSVVVDGVAYETYTFTVPASVAVASTQVPDTETGTVAVTFSIDSADRPVRVDQRFADGGLVVRTDYTAYGSPVEVEVPAVG